MPYASNEALPTCVRDHLPLRAQDIYREAFNHAYRYADEATAHRIAWAAVKHLYEKTDDTWVRRLDR
jgi:cation transport regulator